MGSFGCTLPIAPALTDPHAESGCAQAADREKLEHFPDQPAQQTHLAMTEIGLA